MTGMGEGRRRAVVWWYKEKEWIPERLRMSGFAGHHYPSPRTENAVSHFKCAWIYLSFKTPSNHLSPELSWQQILISTLQCLWKGNSWFRVSMGRWTRPSHTYRIESTEDSHQVFLFIKKYQTNRAHFFPQRMNLLSVQMGQHPFLLRILPWSRRGKKETPEFNVKKWSVGINLFSKI